MSESMLREVCGKSLASYMVPSVFVGLEAWPLNANGKIDRKALPEPELGASMDQYVAPRNALESGLAEAVGEVLVAVSRTVGHVGS